MLHNTESCQEDCLDLRYVCGVVPAMLSGRANMLVMHISVAELDYKINEKYQ